MVQQSPPENCQRAPRKYTGLTYSIPFQEHFRWNLIVLDSKNTWGKLGELYQIVLAKGETIFQ